MSEYQQLFKYIAFALKCSRKLRGLRQIDLAQMAGINPRHYQRIESGTLSNLTIETLYCLTKVLDINLADIFSKYEHSKDFYQLLKSDLTNLDSISTPFSGIVEYLKSLTPPNSTGKFNEVIDHFKNAFLSLDERADFNGIIFGTDVCCSDSTSERYSISKEYTLGRYNEDKNQLMRLCHNYGNKSGGLFLVKQMIARNSVSSPFIFAVIVLTQNPKLPLIIFSGLDCSKHEQLEQNFDTFLIDKVTRQELSDSADQE